MFIDEVKIIAKAGRGGDGIVAFRREKYVPFGGPAGGNGGRGGSIILVGNEGLNTLLKFRYDRHLKASNGESGKSKNQHGKGAENSYYEVPLGTVVKRLDGTYLGEITEHGEELVIAHGGRGGRGNAAFKSNKNQAPNYSEKGLPGEQVELKLELKLMADIGLIGFPNAGKSTLISAISNAKPKIASYPFTTLKPSLGVVKHYEHDFVVADIPGLIENASEGVGLGIQFLRHIERCKIFIHVVDLSQEDPVSNYNVINQELEKYNPKLLERPQIVVLNKIDIVPAEKVEKIKKAIPNSLPISAVSRKNLDKLLNIAVDLIEKTPLPDLEEDYIKIDEIDNLDTKDNLFEVSFDGTNYHVSGDVIYRMFYRVDFSNESAVKRFAYQLKDMGVEDKLKELGAKPGDTVKILDFEFEFIE